jgi:hypothetical protein
MNSPFIIDFWKRQLLGAEGPKAHIIHNHPVRSPSTLAASITKDGNIEKVEKNGRDFEFKRKATNK